MATQIVSSYTTLDRTVALITREIEKADPTAEVIALDFRSATIAKRNSGSAGTHSLRGKSAEGYYVRGAADINVYKKGTRTPHPNEWALLNKYGKTAAIKYGLAYTFPKGPNVYLRSHSGASLHLHIDVSVWGTDYGDCYSPFRSGKGGYYRQSHAGRPKASPPKIGGSTPVGTTQSLHKIDLDRDNVERLQRRLGVTVDGSAGPRTIAALQRKLGVTPDSQFGPNTIRSLQKTLGVDQDASYGPKTKRAFALALWKEGLFA